MARKHRKERNRQRLTWPGHNPPNLKFFTYAGIPPSYRFLVEYEVHWLGTPPALSRRPRLVLANTR